MVKHHVLRIAETSLTLDTNIYHAKVMNHPDVVKLITHREDVNISPPETVMPFKVARDVVLKANDAVAVGTCPCRENVENPCIPPTQQVCMFVGDPFASFIAEQNPKYRKISAGRGGPRAGVRPPEGVCPQRLLQEGGAKPVRGHLQLLQLLLPRDEDVEPAGRAWCPSSTASGYVSEVNDDCNGCAGLRR